MWKSCTDIRKNEEKKPGFKNFTKGDPRKNEVVLKKKSGLTRKKIFEDGVMNVNREQRCRILRALTKDMKITKILLLDKKSIV